MGVGQGHMGTSPPDCNAAWHDGRTLGLSAHGNFALCKHTRTASNFLCRTDAERFGCAQHALTSLPLTLKTYGTPAFLPPPAPTHTPGGAPRPDHGGHWAAGPPAVRAGVGRAQPEVAVPPQLRVSPNAVTNHTHMDTH